MRLVLDQSPAKKKVGAALRGLLASEQAPKLAVAYVSSDIAALLELPRTAAGTLICDPFRGGCNPDELLRLQKAHWNIGCIKGFHAKVYIGSEGVAIGSANLSSGALEEGNAEGLVVIRDEALTRTAAVWFDKLFRRATPFKKLAKDEAWLLGIRAMYKAQRRAFRRGRKKSKRRPIDEVFSDPTFDWSEYAFTLIDTEDEDTSAASKAARQGNISLESDWIHDATLAEGNGQALIDDYTFVANNKLVLGLWVDSTVNHPYFATAFRSLEGYASEFLAAVQLGDYVYCFYEEFEDQLPFTLEARSRSRVCQILNRGLQATGEKLSVLHYVRGEVMANLYKAGMGEDAKKQKTRS